MACPHSSTEQHYSTLRRLRADHKDLAIHGLPPNYLFPSEDSSHSAAHNLAQFTILLVGPRGTPYSQGIWRVQLSIPDDYPQNPPKASFRTRIWHPNVDESSGHICVETLKRDWEQKLTLRDILLTISCLLINPNPDSALNSTAGHLLQEDYEAFARQARLMTSIHARISHDMQGTADAARVRGEDTRTLEKAEVNPKSQTVGGQAVSRSGIIMQTKSKDISLRPERAASRSTPPPQAFDPDSEPAADVEGEAAKENVDLLFPARVPAQRKKTALLKRPLSDLPVPQESEAEADQRIESSTSERNVAINLPHRQTSSFVRQGNEINQSKGLYHDESSTITMPWEPLTCNNDGEAYEAEPPAKRVCLAESQKHDPQRILVTASPNAVAANLRTRILSPNYADTKKGNPAQEFGHGTSRVRKARIGLRRL